MQATQVAPSSSSALSRSDFGRHPSDVVQVQPRSTEDSQGMTRRALPVDSQEDALNDDWVIRTSVIYHDVSNWLESRIPPPSEYQDQKQPQGIRRKKTSNNVESQTGHSILRPKKKSNRCWRKPRGRNIGRPVKRHARTRTGMKRFKWKMARYFSHGCYSKIRSSFEDFEH